MSTLDWVLGIGFILVSLVGGVILAGIVGGNPAFVVAGICFILLGVLALYNANKYEPKGQDESFNILTSFGRMPLWGWVVAIVLLVVAFGSFAVL